MLKDFLASSSLSEIELEPRVVCMLRLMSYSQGVRASGMMPSLRGEDTGSEMSSCTVMEEGLSDFKVCVTVFPGALKPT